MTRTLCSRVAKLEALAPLRSFVLFVRTPEEADTHLANHTRGAVVVVPPVAETVEEWLNEIEKERICEPSKAVLPD
jgi:hypothetical protein